MASSQAEPLLAPPSSSSSLSFTQGFLLGQLSVALFLAAFIKFFIFGDPPSDSSRTRNRSASTPFRSSLSPTHKRSVSFTPLSSSSPLSASTRQRRRSSSTSAPQHHHIIRPPRPLDAAAILAKAYYNVAGHQPESLDWFNVLVGQALAQLRADAATDGAVLASLTAVLNGPAKPDFVEKIAVTEISLGEEFPIFSNCRVQPVQDDEEGVGGGGGGGESGWGGWTGGGASAAGGTTSGPSGGSGRLQARMDVDLSDILTLGVETTLVLNYPRPRSAVLPVALSVSVLRFSGTLAISFVPASTAAAAAAATTAGGMPGGPATPGGPSPAGPTSPNYAADPSDPFTSSPPPTRTPTTLAFSFQPTYTLSLSTRSLLGARSRLQDVPKIAQLVESRLRTWFEERCVAPRRQQIVIPSLWPRMKNVVEAGAAASAGGSGAGASGGAGSGAGAAGATPGSPSSATAGMEGAGNAESIGAKPTEMPPAPRDLRAEAMREIEEEKRRRREQTSQRLWEGLRWRGAGDGGARPAHAAPYGERAFMGIDSGGGIDSGDATDEREWSGEPGAGAGGQSSFEMPGSMPGGM